MRFELKYPTGSAHEIELEGTVAVLGRDPSCDLVLNDTKCSRRHAIVEAGPQGIAIRDAGSANGIFVNGKKVERANLAPGDQIRLGEVLIRVLPEDMPGTVVMGPEEVSAQGGLAGRPAAPSPPKPPPPPPAEYPTTRPSPAQEAPKPGRPAPPRPPPPIPRPSTPAFRDAEPSGAARPVTVTILTVLWGASIFFYGGLGGWLGFAAHLGTVPAIASGVTCGFLMIMSVIMAAGIWSLSPWARTLQIFFAGIGLIVCPITLPSAVILAYFIRTQARIRFSRAPLSASDQETLARDTAEGAFAAALIGTVLIGILLSAGAGFGYTRFFQPRGAPVETPSQP